MEDHSFNSLAITHLLQHTLRSLCAHQNSHWLYAVFWRILPRNFPPPKWDFQGAACDRGRGNRRNWILVWEDGYCNFASPPAVEPPGGSGSGSSPATYGNARDEAQSPKGLQPELFFKMSHEIYNYGEGLIGKVAADHGHKWVYNEPQEHEINLLSAWTNPADYHPRTWEAQFQSGIKTIALIAVKEGVIQLGAVNKVVEDISFIIFLRKKFAYLESIPGVLLPHTSSSAVPIRIGGCDPQLPADSWLAVPESMAAPVAPMFEMYNHLGHHQIRITPSMNSLEALLSKLPSVGPAPPPAGLPEHLGGYEMPMLVTSAAQRPDTDDGGEGERVAKEEVDEYGAGQSSGSMPAYPNYYVNMSKPAGEF